MCHRTLGFCVRFRASGSALLLRDLEAKVTYLTGEGRSCSIRVLSDSDPDLPDFSKYENVADLPHPSWHAGSCVFSISGDSLAVRDMGEITGWVHKYFGSGINVTEGASARTVVLTFPDIGMADAFVHNYMHNDPTVYLLKGKLVNVQGHLTDEKVEPVDLVVGDWDLQVGYLNLPLLVPPNGPHAGGFRLDSPQHSAAQLAQGCSIATPDSEVDGGHPEYFSRHAGGVPRSRPDLFITSLVFSGWNSSLAGQLAKDRSSSAFGIQSRSLLSTRRGTYAWEAFHGQKNQ